MTDLHTIIMQYIMLKKTAQASPIFLTYAISLAG